MSPIVSGLLLMTFGAFLAGGAISFRKQKITVIAQIVLWVLAVVLFAYGFYVTTLD
ncbi:MULTISPECIES: hypothetical protein [Rothia]|uniref:hypothetical protein n=1 Tax=unclassified Kocuria TaxID=2649579 RepID=UPI0013EC637A|nr:MULTISPECIES: hypothetical protein [unclassified Kocuria]